MVTIDKMKPKLISVTVFDGISCHYPWFIVKITDGTTVKDLCKAVLSLEYDGMIGLPEIPGSRNPLTNENFDVHINTKIKYPPSSIF